MKSKINESDLFLHCWLECQDTQEGKWYEAQICDIDENNNKCIKIHYKGDIERYYDEWIDLNDESNFERISRLHTNISKPGTMTGDHNYQHEPNEIEFIVSQTYHVLNESDRWCQAELVDLDTSRGYCKFRYIPNNENQHQEIIEWINQDSYRIAPIEPAMAPIMTPIITPNTGSNNNDNMYNNNMYNNTNNIGGDSSTNYSVQGLVINNQEYLVNEWIHCVYERRRYQAQIVQITFDNNNIYHMKVHYKGFDSTYDEWIDIVNTNIQHPRIGKLSKATNHKNNGNWNNGTHNHIDNINYNEGYHTNVNMNNNMNNNVNNNMNNNSNNGNNLNINRVNSNSMVRPQEERARQERRDDEAAADEMLIRIGRCRSITLAILSVAFIILGVILDSTILILIFAILLIISIVGGIFYPKTMFVFFTILRVCI